MTLKKGLAVILLATTTLAACGSNPEDGKEEEVLEEEVVQIDLSAEVADYLAYATAQMPDFLADSKLLASYVNEGKLEEAQKLFPLVTMYYERLQPMTASFSELDAKINSPLVEGEEAEATGFEKIAYGLFSEKTTKGYEAVAEGLVTNIQTLEQQLPELEIKDQQFVNDAVAMMDELVTTRLTAEGSLANAEVYATKATTEAIEELTEILMTRADSEKAAKVVEATAALNDVVAYYEVGKEDYINYSYFTKTQKEEFLTAVTEVRDAFNAMVQSIQ